MSERVGSDIERLWVLNNKLLLITRFSIDPKSIEYLVIEIQSRSISDPTLSDIDFKNKMAMVWATLKTNDYN